MINLIFLLFISCSSKQKNINHITARDYFKETNDCLESLKDYMKKADCEELAFVNLGEHDIMMRCHKPQEERSSFWDNYIFRISSPYLQYDAQTKILIDSHTICLDKGVRIEAYPPNKDQ